MKQRLALAATAAAIFCHGTHAEPRGDDNTLPRCVSFDVGGDNASAVALSLFIGGFTSPIAGRITLGLGDVAAPAIPGFVGVSVGEARLLAMDWSPDPPIGLSNPTVFIPDPGEASRGIWNPTTGEIILQLRLFPLEGPLGVPLPLLMTGTLTNASLSIQGDNGNIPDGTFALTLEGDRVRCEREVFFSTENGFTSLSGGAFNPVSDGDLLSNTRCLVKRNGELTARLGFMPIVPDLGLDAATNVAFGPVLFSLEESHFSEILGPISHGDLLSDDGRILRTNRQLLENFGPNVTTLDAGLDALHLGEYPFDASFGGLFFSTEEPFFSSSQQATIGHGDLLSDRGFVLATNQQLLAPFEPACAIEPCQFDFGLDGLWIFPSGEIWFSVEEGFVSHRLGFISDGAILSSTGVVVADNLDLVWQCQPAEDVDNFGLDALDVDRCPPCHLRCRFDIDGDGFIGATDLARVLGAWGVVCILPCEEDFDGDGTVGSGDLAILLGKWGPCTIVVPPGAGG